jgi:cob(I)alamin adenosyltransferase
MLTAARRPGDWITSAGEITKTTLNRKDLKMADDQVDEQMFEGVGDPARQKTLGERSVSDQDIEEIREDIAELNEDLAKLRAEGDATFGKEG